MCIRFGVCRVFCFFVGHSLLHVAVHKRQEGVSSRCQQASDMAVDGRHLCPNACFSLCCIVACGPFPAPPPPNNALQAVVKQLLAAGADPNVRSSNGSSPLLEAAMAVSPTIQVRAVVVRNLEGLQKMGFLWVVVAVVGDLVRKPLAYDRRRAVAVPAELAAALKPPFAAQVC